MNIQNKTTHKWNDVKPTAQTSMIIKQTLIEVQERDWFGHEATLCVAHSMIIINELTHDKKKQATPKSKSEPVPHTSRLSTHLTEFD